MNHAPRMRAVVRRYKQLLSGSWFVDRAKGKQYGSGSWFIVANVQFHAILGKSYDIVSHIVLIS